MAVMVYGSSVAQQHLVLQRDVARAACRAGNTSEEATNFRAGLTKK
jgi:hypothetical protein